MKRPTNRTQTVVANATVQMLRDELKRRGFRSYPEERIKVTTIHRCLNEQVRDDPGYVADARKNLATSHGRWMMENNGLLFEEREDRVHDGGLIISATACVVLPKTKESKR